MSQGPPSARRPILPPDDPGRPERDGGRWGSLSCPEWADFVRLCQELRFGEIERVKIQDGRPVLAEVVKKKIRFSR